MSTEVTVETRTDSLVRLESEVGVLIRRARRMMGERARLIYPGMHGGSYLMLVWIANNGPVRAGAVAEEFCIDKGAVSRMVQSLVEAGFVERHPDPADGRAHLVSVTAETARRLDELSSARRDRLDERLSDWSVADMASFREMLGRYNEALEP